ncbi:MAG: hypothetical protein J6B68_02605 [Lachnospiraceae bacterium]|nr:hypothetical protein [Lachnospiraceae bacterium]
MKRIIKSMETKYETKSLNLVEKVFTEHDNEQEGKLVRSLVEGNPAKTVHLPSIDCLMATELVEGALNHIHGYVEYDCYKSLT